MLDITAMSNVLTDDELLGLGDELFSDNEMTIYNIPNFYNRCHSFRFEDGKSTIYKSPSTETYEFRVGSSRGYNQFRNHLCKAIHKIDCSTQFNAFAPTLSDLDKLIYKEFGELFDFTDSDGTICYSVAKELHSDFMNNRSNFEGYLNNNSLVLPILSEEKIWLLLNYDEFTRAFSIAKDKGIVIFN